jgi:hypothetical protein
MVGGELDESVGIDAPGWNRELAESELQECHQHYRAATDQIFKAIAFLSTATAALLVVAIEQESGLALVVAAIPPMAGWIIARYLGRQFGAAVSYGAILESLLHGGASGFFWGHWRSANPSSAENFKQKVQRMNQGEAPEHDAWVIYTPFTGSSR